MDGDRHDTGFTTREAASLLAFSQAGPSAKCHFAGRLDPRNMIWRGKIACVGVAVGHC